MRSIILLPFAFIMTMQVSKALAQTKIILTMDGKESDIFGYAMDPSTGSSREIIMFGPMQNAAMPFEFGLESGNLIPAINLSITDAFTGASTINLTNVTVLAIKQYISTYTNGSFTISPGGNLNTEVKCKFEKIEIKTSTAKNTISPKNISGSQNVNTPANSNQEKWVISNADIKGASGKISVNLPADVDCSIKVFDPTDNNKYLGSFNKSDPIILFPGFYNVKISEVDVNGVTVQLGMETKLKTGILSLVSPADFKLFDITKKNYLGSYIGPKKIGLPVGTYQVSLNNHFQQIVIKDGETLEL